MQLSAMVVIMESAGCVCVPPSAPTAGQIGPGAGGIAGGAAIGTAAAAATAQAAAVAAQVAAMQQQRRQP